MNDKPTVAVKREKADDIAAALRNEYSPAIPPGPTADTYRIAGYVDGLVGAAKPECDLLLPHFDSGLKWADANHPLPDDPLWGGGVRAGVRWDGTFWRDLARYAAGGQFFWSAYLVIGVKGKGAWQHWSG